MSLARRNQSDPDLEALKDIWYFLPWWKRNIIWFKAELAHLFLQPEEEQLQAHWVGR